MKSDKVKDNEETISKNNAQIEDLKSENLKLLADINALGIDESKKVELVKNIDKLKRIGDRLSDSILKCKAEVSFYEKNQTCSTCKQQISDDIKSKEIDALTKKIKEFEDASISSQDNLKKFNQQLQSIKELDNAKFDIEHKISKHQNTIHAIEQFISRVISENEKLNNTKDDQQKYTNALKDIEDVIVSLESEKQSLLYDKDLSETAISLLKDDGVKAKIIKQYLPLINKHTNLYLNSMNFFVSFNIDEEFNECIKSRGRDIFSYENFSEGEKQRIDLALLLTWRTIAKLKNSINTNLLIMDEVLDSYLDNSATENVLQLLTSDVFKNTNVFVISHKETISDKFNGVIQFSKAKNFSSVS
jgi:DNA repair exonuclease SbcCD ATPase subunit